MDKYNGLLSKIAHQYHILKGDQESDNEWKNRLIYSICGMMGYASLWDNAEEPISIVHLKNRVLSTIYSYQSIYPELSESLLLPPETLANEVVDQFRTSGIVYHRSKRISPSIKREEAFSGILFQRGIALDNISCVSGVGFYSIIDSETNSEDLKEMFGLETQDLKALWKNTLSNASWSSKMGLDYNTEYLRLKPPYTRGYWVDRPDRSGVVSILRTGMKGSELYYLYRNKDGKLEVSPLKEWQVKTYDKEERHNYRTLACACLSTYETLPPIEYLEDGPLVHVRMGYLLPPRELGFLKLYSWPDTRGMLRSDFKRKVSLEVFNAMKEILSIEGYIFKDLKEG